MNRIEEIKYLRLRYRSFLLERKKNAALLVACRLRALLKKQLQAEIRADKTRSRSNRQQTKYPGHLAEIRQMPCLICLCVPSEAAHVRMSSAKYNKTNGRNDKWVVPLCAGHHRLFPDAQHNSGETKWWNKHGIDPLEIAESLWFKYL